MSLRRLRCLEIQVILVHKNLIHLRQNCRLGLVVLQKTSPFVLLSLLKLWGLVRILMSPWE
uniref:Uncharacterized protein n=1 Tax=Arundo donax TaxID=35708 RepID=A0A0A9DD71_ARUDO